MLFLILFFIAITNLSIFWCSHSVYKIDSNSFLFEDGSLIVDCFNRNSCECLHQLITYKFVNKLYLKGFVFDEENTKQFSNILCKMPLQYLTLSQCNINDELMSLLVLPFGLKLIKFERLNLSAEGIQNIIDKLPLSLESLEIMDCLYSKFSRQALSTNSSLPKILLDLTGFSSLKNICINNLNYNFDSYHFLCSLLSLPLERIKLSRIHLSTEHWTKLLKEWKEPNGVAFSNSLKEFDLKIGDINTNSLNLLVQFLFSISSLEIISISLWCWVGIASLPPLPSNIKQLSISFRKVFMEDGKTSFYNSKNLSQLTHLTLDNFSSAFPYFLFDLNQLEYLKIYDWNESHYPLEIEKYCDKLKYLSIQSKYLIPLLINFEEKFPQIETLDISWAHWENLAPHLKTIISSKTLKCLQINYEYNKETTLNIENGITSSIEELKLSSVHWEFVSSLLNVKRFPCLKKIFINTKNKGLDLGKVFEKLSSFPQLTSLTLFGDYFLSDKQLPFTFKSINFFRLRGFKESFDLDCLFSCMPNLIELQLMGKSLRELKLQNSIGIRYLELPSNFNENNGNFINIFKNFPNLIQLTTRQYCSISTYSVPFVSELAYYFKELKEHFKNELKFEINPNSFPIKQLKNNAKLLKLIRLKSPELPKYLEHIFPKKTFQSCVEQLFTIEINSDFCLGFDDFIFKYFPFIAKLEVKKIDLDDFWLMEALLSDSEEKIELSEFSLQSFYHLVAEFFVKNAKVKLNECHLDFIKKYFNNNSPDKQYGMLKFTRFFNPFFPLLFQNESAIIIVDSESPTKFNNLEFLSLFIKNILSNSFFTLIDRIKNSKLSKAEKEQFVALSSLNFELLSLQLNYLSDVSYRQFVDYFDHMFFDSDGILNPIEALISGFKIFSSIHDNCPICLSSLIQSKCKFFCSKANKLCHLFHENCLKNYEEILKTTKKPYKCPNCRAE